MIDKKNLSERDICTKFITPAIEQLGWMLFLKIFSDKDKELKLLDDYYTSPIPR